MRVLRASVATAGSAVSGRIVASLDIIAGPVVGEFWVDEEVVVEDEEHDPLPIRQKAMTAISGAREKARRAGQRWVLMGRRF